MNIAIAGGTGLIGRALTKYFIEKGHTVFVLTRNPRPNEHNIQYIKWLTDDSHPERELKPLDAFINLAGESLNSGRWTKKKKEEIINSRVESTQEAISLMSKLEQLPSVFINSSGISYYGASFDAIFTEASETISSQGFLTDVAYLWEKEAKAAEALGVRTVIARTGVVLDKQQGALPKMVLPYRLLAGGTIGSGKQWISWIHLHDVVRLFEFVIQHKEMDGPVNFTSPYPVTMKEFGKTISNVLHRPHWLPVPGVAFKLILGEMSTLLLDGQKVLPDKAKSHGFSFEYPELSTALQGIYS
ncbi:TIGR01777 family oxidoreductase [Alkalihalobacillus sp. LMS39]|uniref:TIGR01777 family oxidoreductase n=1 Tax=Alkalihalobacillus sp. LMS39 TaxID=2924032 RepID=UPI001FB35B4F|nr:TIGR01777 family oxidoreductase [Alkalihalobacillus sp. LMS39]UOE94938.1 TIGR01777 family oxidoreductase [Alkalihalobacillus sp. LMS39]